MLIGPANLVLTAPPLLRPELLQRKAFSAVTSVTFSGLNGNYDEQYIVELRAENVATADKVLVVRPNGDANANYKSFHHAFIESGTTPDHNVGSDDARNGLYLINTIWQDNNWMWAQGALDAPSGKNRLWMATGVVIDTEDLAKFGPFHAAGVWKNTADNITSLVIDFHGANTTGTAWLYRLKRPRR